MGLVRLKSLIVSRQKAPWESLRRLVPRRAESVVETIGEDGLVRLAVPLARRRHALGRFAKSMGRDDLKNYELEPIGAFVWGLIDGGRNLESICKALQDEYKLGSRESQIALCAFTEMLQNRGLTTIDGSRS